MLLGAELLCWIIWYLPASQSHFIQLWFTMQECSKKLSGTYTFIFLSFSFFLSSAFEWEQRVFNLLFWWSHYSCLSPLSFSNQRNNHCNHFALLIIPSLRCHPGAGISVNKGSIWLPFFFPLCQRWSYIFSACNVSLPRLLDVQDFLLWEMYASSHLSHLGLEFTNV